MKLFEYYLDTGTCSGLLEEKVEAIYHAQQINFFRMNSSLREPFNKFGFHFTNTYEIRLENFVYIYSSVRFAMYAKVKRLFRIYNDHGFIVLMFHPQKSRTSLAAGF